MTDKKEEAFGNKVGRMKNLMIRIAKHSDLTVEQKLKALSDMGVLVVEEKFKEDEFAILKDCMEGLAKVM